MGDLLEEAATPEWLKKQWEESDNVLRGTHSKLLDTSKTVVCIDEDSMNAALKESEDIYFDLRGVMQPIEKIIKAGREFTEAKVFEEFEEFDNHLTQLKLTFNQLGKFVCKRKEYLEKSIGQLIKLENEIESTEKQLVKIDHYIEERDLDNV